MILYGQCLPRSQESLTALLEIFVMVNINMSFTSFIDVSFELPSVDDFHSPSELKFKTENAEIYIPYASLRYQMEVEGMTMLSSKVQYT